MLLLLLLLPDRSLARGRPPLTMTMSVSIPVQPGIKLLLLMDGPDGARRASSRVKVRVTGFPRAQRTWE
jgi:hypothetical protein